MRLRRRSILTTAVLAASVLSSSALASGSVLGTYTTTITKPSDLRGKWTLVLAKGSSYRVVLNGETVAKGTYSATASTITFVRETGSPCKGSGTYGWQRSGSTMTFTRKREAASCHARATILAHRFTRVH